ncbi:MAG: DUF4445 domain-containing protein [Oscillospiraceae bacterium]|nr:DUF4445 domain-containing protein [Oscillospiraceae bacterium]
MKITFRLPGKTPVTIECSAGENLLELARRAGVPMDAPCSGAGTCGKCRVQLLEGGVDTVLNRHISPEERRKGWVLACKSTVRENCAVFVPESASAWQVDIRTADYSVEETETADAEQVACAIDIGTTTVSAVLMDLKTGKLLAKASVGNGQIRYGADVINRIIQQSRLGGREKLQDAVLKETMIPLMEKLCADAGVEADKISRIAIAANTTMNHLLLGVDANPIRLEPYEPVFLSQKGLKAADLNLPASPNAELIMAPNVGSYVGGDITAGILATDIWKSDEMSLFIDLGTNGEIVFGNREFLMTCACSAGPAFEGGDISWGMRATMGAVEAVTIDADTMEPTLRVIGGGTCGGICGSGLIDLVAELFRHGIINPKGKFIRKGGRVRTDDFGCSRYVLAWSEESANGREIFIDEVDIDNFIRAKAAIYSGIDTLLQAVDMTPDCIDRVLVAGGIGSGINMKNAVSIGMLPNVALEKYRYAGNTALQGARAMALHDEAVTQCDEVAENMTYMELSTCQGYMDSFVAACFLPHTDRKLFSNIM